MVNLRLIPYEVTIKNLDNGNNLNLDNLNLKKIFEKFLSRNKDISVLNNREKIFSIKETIIKENLILGIIGSGNFGFTRELVETTQKKRISKITSTQADEIPFYFIMRILEDKALFLISFFKNYSVKNIFQERLKEFLKSQIDFKNKNLIFSPIIDPKLFKKELKEIQKLRLIRTVSPNDIETKMDIELIEDKKKKNKKLVKDEQIFSISSRGLRGISHTIIDQINNKRESGYYKIGEEKYDDAEIEIKLKNGTMRKINIEHLEIKQSTSIEFLKDFPTIKNFYKKALPYFNEIKNQMGKTK